MLKTNAVSIKFRFLPVALAGLLSQLGSPVIVAQKPRTPLAESVPTSPHRTRLILKDGSYQVVMSYRVDGGNVRYVSAERGGAEEVIPVSLVDLDATRLWEQRHTRPDPDAAPPAPAAIDPELLKEEADRAALTPEVAPDLRLPEQDSVLALDAFRGTPELLPLAQSAGELNRNTAHNILRSMVNPMAAPHSIVELKGTRSPLQLHVTDPVFFLRVGDAAPAGGTFTVDTHGATGNANTASAGGSHTSRYVVVRTDVRTDSRVVASVNPSLLEGTGRHEDVVETASEQLPGGHWMKLTPKEPLPFGEYALLEIISDREINLGVWDFGVHPVAPENRDSIKPEPKRPFALEHRRPD